MYETHFQQVRTCSFFPPGASWSLIGSQEEIQKEEIMKIRYRWTFFGIGLALAVGLGNSWHMVPGRGKIRYRQFFGGPDDGNVRLRNFRHH
jgi:hypothetical protein